jgi:hypothetical protein
MMRLVVAPGLGKPWQREEPADDFGGLSRFTGVIS